jgi:hypothetical protein
MCFVWRKYERHRPAVFWSENFMGREQLRDQVMPIWNDNVEMSVEETSCDGMDCSHSYDWKRVECRVPVSKVTNIQRSIKAENFQII